MTKDGKPKDDLTVIEDDGCWYVIDSRRSHHAIWICDQCGGLALDRSQQGACGVAALKRDGGSMPYASK
jgi:frataxin-like iron-binding protein CyaY